MAYTVRLGNGKVLGGLDLSGNTFLTKQVISEADFVGGLKRVKIEGPAPENPSDDIRGEYEQMRLEAIIPMGEVRGFVLSEVVAARPESGEALRADVDYLLMLSEEVSEDA